MNILYIVTSSDMGGAQKYTLDLATIFNSVIAYGEDGSYLPSICKKNNIKSIHLKYLKRDINPILDILAFFELLFVIYKSKCDIVHLNSSKAGLLGSLAGKLLFKKVIYTAHGFVFAESGSRLKKSLYVCLEKLASYFRDHIITVSESDHKLALLYSIAPANKLTTIHNGIEAVNFYTKEDARRKLNLNQEDFIFGLIANDYPSKGIDILLKAFGEIKNEKIKLAIIGDCKRTIDANVNLTGPLTDANRYLKAFDCFVMPSLKEGFPYAILEAMQAELPIIATDVGGIKEALSDTGILIESNKEKTLTEAMMLIHKDPLLQKTLSKKAKERSTLFTLEAMTEKTKLLYNEKN